MLISLRWSDRRSSSLVVGDRDSILNVYAMLARERLALSRKGRDADELPQAIHCYDANSGLELDPERGLESIAVLEYLGERQRPSASPAP